MVVSSPALYPVGSLAISRHPCPQSAFTLLDTPRHLASSPPPQPTGIIASPMVSTGMDPEEFAWRWTFICPRLRLPSHSITGSPGICRITAAQHFPALLGLTSNRTAEASAL